MPSTRWARARVRRAVCDHRNPVRHPSRPMAFSPRVPNDLTPTPLSQRLSRAADAGAIDLTLANPTRADFLYPADILTPLADANALDYDPQPLGAPRARLAVQRHLHLSR